MSEFNKNAVCYDNTRLSDYKTCPRKYYMRHIMGWAPEGTGDALVFGKAWHEGQDVIWKLGKAFGEGKISHVDLTNLAFSAFCDEWEANNFPLDMDFGGYDRFGARTPGTAKEMIYAYIKERAHPLTHATVLAIEQPFAVPVPGIDNTWYVGRLDKVVDYNSQVLVLEHKSTTAYSRESGFRADYVESWFSSSQVKGYQFGAGLFYPALAAVWVDAALVHAKVHDEFRFIPVAHHPDLLKEWLDNTKRWIGLINDGRAADEHGAPLAQTFPKNEDSCFGKFGKCQFLDICRTCPDPRALTEVPPGFEVNRWEPFDLLGLDKLVKGEGK